MDSESPSKGKQLRRAKKRASSDSERRSASKPTEAREKTIRSASFPEADSAQDVADSAVSDGMTDRSSGDSSSSEVLSMNSVLDLILSQKKKELLELSEVAQLLHQSSQET